MKSWPVLCDEPPMKAYLGITAQCNYYCEHCFMAGARQKRDVMAFDSWVRVIGELKRLGCRFLVFTGGECLSSEYFIELYEYAWKTNMYISVMTNGSLLANSVLAALVNRPPFKVAVGLYGFTNESYAAFCGGKADVVYENIETAARLGIRIELRYILSKYNAQEMSRAKQFAEGANLPITAVGGLFPALNGDTTPLLCSAEIEDELRALELFNTASPYEKNQSERHCPAGFRSCYIGSDGMMRLCQVAVFPEESVRALGVANCWDLMRAHRKAFTRVKSRCICCDYKLFCGKCAPISELFPDDYERCKKRGAQLKRYWQSRREVCGDL